jgi:hypothetical protein
MCLIKTVLTHFSLWTLHTSQLGQFAINLKCTRARRRSTLIIPRAKVGSIYSKVRLLWSAGLWKKKMVRLRNISPWSSRLEGRCHYRRGLHAVIAMFESLGEFDTFFCESSSVRLTLSAFDLVTLPIRLCLVLRGLFRS